MPTRRTTAAWTSIRRLWLPSAAALALGSCAPVGEPQVRRADSAVDAREVNQLVVAGNACGPAALLNSLRFGDAKWRKALPAIDGETDRGQLLTIIRRHGLRPSPHLGGRPRWGRRGINVVDLTDIANEIASPSGLPEVRHEILVANSVESPARQLKRTHRHLESSLANGLPPLLSIRRFALRRKPGGAVEWTVIDSHMVTIIESPHRLPRNATEFNVGYIDPWGGQRHHGEIRVANGVSGAVSPFLEARFPSANVSKHRVLPGERTTLVVSAVIGRW